MAILSFVPRMVSLHGAGFDQHFPAQQLPVPLLEMYSACCSPATGHRDGWGVLKKAFCYHFSCRQSFEVVR